MRNKLVLYIILLSIFYSNYIFAHDNQVIHPIITESALASTTLNNYLMNNIGLNDGVKTEFPANSSKTVLYWFREGSKQEDSPMCRASNHFHDPMNTKLWNAAGMGDSPWWINNYCHDYTPFYSTVTWATGFIEPTSTPIPYNQDNAKSPNMWGNARSLYYNALSATAKADRETNFAQTFLALGQVLHLLEDMSVPAHVRNDFESHLTFSGVLDKDGNLLFDPTQWFYNPFEYYVKNNSQLVSTAVAKTLTIANSRLTDFLDTNQYNGTNPSNSTMLGLAEITTANYFSNNTIPNNNPSAEHIYPFPAINSNNYHICEHNEMGTTNPRKYICRNNASNPFNAISLLNEEPSITNDNISTLATVLDDNVHDTYAKELLPLAIGYSSQVLKYFFRGQMEVKCLPVIEENKIIYVELDVKNTTLDEAMTNGKLMLTGKYLDSNNEEKLVRAYYWTPSDGRLYEHAGIPLLNSGQLLKTIHFWFTEENEIPVDKWDSIKLTLTYQGKLGNEEGAVIGKVFSPGKLKFNEEWNNGLSGNHNWFHLADNYKDPDCANITGYNTSSQSGTLLVKDNSGAIGSSPGSCGTHFNETTIFKERDTTFPIPITPNTSLQFKIPQMTTNAPNPTWDYDGNWQIMALWFADGQNTYVFMISLGDQFFYSPDPDVFYFTFDPAFMMIDNFQDMFQLYGVNSLPNNLQLIQIDFVQKANSNMTLPGQQKMIVDFVRVIEKGDTELVQTP